MPGPLRWPSLRRRRIVRCANEDGVIFANCFGPDVYPCCAAYHWRGFWCARSRVAAGDGCGDEGKRISGDGSDAELWGFLYGAWSGGKRLSDAGSGCVLAAWFVGEDRCTAATAGSGYIPDW